MVKMILAVIMLAWGAILMMALDCPEMGTVWIVGAILLSWMPDQK